MSDEQHLPGGGVRRVGRKDRKPRLDPAAPLFPQAEPEERDSPPRPLPFDDVQAQAGEVDEALRALGELERLPEIGAVIQEERPFGPPHPTQVAVPEERFPPLNPEVPELPSPVLPTRPPRMARQDRIAIFFFLATFVLLGWMIAVWQNPQSALNPFPPATRFAEITATPQPQPSTTPTEPPTVAPTPSFTPLVEIALQRTADSGSFPTPTPGSPSGGGSATSTPSPYPFALAETGVVYAPNNNGRGCDWSSIAGTVTGLRGEPLDGYGIHIVGDVLDEKVFSGTAQTFGPGGFELFLNGVPQPARYTVRLLSAAGAPLSDEIVVVTSDQCSQNVALVNFVQQRAF